MGERRTVLKDSSQTREKVRVAVQTKNSVAWVDAIIPFNIAFGPVATLIQLLILNLNGSVIDVALAITLFNAVSIPAAVVWGFVADRYQRRKIIIVASYFSSALILVSFLFAGTGYWVSLLYGAFSFVTAASTTPLNLLVMETEQKKVGNCVRSVLYGYEHWANRWVVG